MGTSDYVRDEIRSIIGGLLSQMYYDRTTFSPYHIKILGDGRIHLQSIGPVGISAEERQAYKDEIWPELMRAAEKWISEISPGSGTDGGAAANRLKLAHAEEALDEKFDQFEMTLEELIDELPAIDFDLPDDQAPMYIEVTVEDDQGHSKSDSLWL